MQPAAPAFLRRVGSSHSRKAITAGSYEAASAITKDFLYDRVPRVPRPNPKLQNQPFQTMNKTEYQCRECGTACVESFDVQWLQCPICSPICRDKPPDFSPNGEWGFPEVDGVELEFSSCMGSITESALEH